MKNSRCSRRPVWLAGAALLTAAAPHAASAQAVGGFLRPDSASSPRTNASAGSSRPGTVVPSRSVQTGPSQFGQFSGRPAAPFSASPFSSRPAPASGIGPAVILPEEQPHPAPYSPGQMTITEGRRGGDRNGQGRSVYNGYDNNYGNNYSNNYGQAGSSAGYDSGYNSSPTNRLTAPVGPANGFWSTPIPPVGPANGFSSSSILRVNTPLGRQDIPRDTYRRNYIYSGSASPSIIVGGPPLLGGYYYGGYCDQAYSTYTYPSVYSVYTGFPQFLCSPNVIVVSQSPLPVYISSPLPFSQPLYSVTYNNNYYYVASESRARDLEAGGEPAKQALQNAYPADSYQAAFGDIARAWLNGDIALFQKHVRDDDTRLSVFLNTKYSYSIAASDFVQITRDAMDRLNTVSFEFTHLRKAKNGDVTAFGKHVYRAGDLSGSSADSRVGEIVPFDQSLPDTGTAPITGQALSGEKKTVYVSYTLSHRADQWYIVALDSSENDLVKSQ